MSTNCPPLSCATEAIEGALFDGSSAEHVRIRCLFYNVSFDRCLAQPNGITRVSCSRFTKLYWVGLGWKTYQKYFMKTNERHHNPRPHPNPRKFRKKKVKINKCQVLDETHQCHNSGPQPNPRKFRKQNGYQYDFGRCQLIFLGPGWPSVAKFS